MSKRNKQAGAKPAANKKQMSPNSVTLEITDQSITKQHAARTVQDAVAHANGFGDKIIVNPNPLTFELRMVDGVMRLVQRTIDGLDLMHRNGTISDVELAIARNFQDQFEIANLADIKAVDLQGAGGKTALGPEDFIHIRMHARDKIDAWYEVLGGRQAIGAIALRYIVGQRQSLSQMTMHFSHGVHVWRGSLITALQVIAKHEDKRKASKGQIRAATNL